MNNKEFISELAKRTNNTPPNVTKLVESFEAILKSHLEENDTLSAMGFGTFEVKKKMERISVNPATGKRYLVPPKLSLAFKPSTVLKDRFNGTGVVPDEDDDSSNNA